MRVVIDCNVVVAAARTDGVCRTILRDIVRRHELVLSRPIIEEYRMVGARPKHRTYHATMLAITDLLEAIAEVVEPDERTFGLIDPDDEVYLATAIAGGADMLITGNRRHFPERRYGPVVVVTPAEFRMQLR